VNIGRRLWHIAKHGIEETVERIEHATSGFVDPARRELDEFLHSQETVRLRTGVSAAGAPPRPRTAPAPHPLAAEYALLGAPIGSDLDTVHLHWRQRVREHHPDRFASDPDAQARANDRLRCINEAHGRLRKHLGG
jgi:DnaJ-domain-containing protein 1